jgi:hypothetical protein
MSRFASSLTAGAIAIVGLVFPMFSHGHLARMTFGTLLVYCATLVAAIGTAFAIYWTPSVLATRFAFALLAIQLVIVVLHIAILATTQVGGWSVPEILAAVTIFTTMWSFDRIRYPEQTPRSHDV